MAPVDSVVRGIPVGPFGHTLQAFVVASAAVIDPIYIIKITLSVSR